MGTSAAVHGPEVHGVHRGNPRGSHLALAWKESLRRSAKRRDSQWFDMRTGSVESGVASQSRKDELRSRPGQEHIAMLLTRRDQCCSSIACVRTQPT